MIPLNQKVKIISSNSGLDEWGIPVKTDHVKTYKVRLDFNSQARVVYDGIIGKEVVFNASIYFKGDVGISYDDFVEYESGTTRGLVKSTPKNISPITDLSGKVTYTKVVV